jgi:hypothetical protein
MPDLALQLREIIPYDVFTDTEVAILFPGTANSRYGLVKRALAARDLIRLRRGVYAFSRRWQRQPLNLFEAAQKLYAPSYVSLESALAFHGWIPEAVYTTTSAATHRSVEVETEVGLFSFTHIAAFNMIGVERHHEKSSPFLLASPTKALFDYVVVNRLDVKSLRELCASLRIETEHQLQIDWAMLDELRMTQRSGRSLTSLCTEQQE